MELNVELLLLEVHLLLQQNRLQSLIEEIARQQRKKCKRGECWVRLLSLFFSHGIYDKLLAELQMEYVKTFKNMLRMEPATGMGNLEEGYLYEKSRIKTVHHLVLPGHMGVVKSPRSQSFSFWVAHNTVSLMVFQVCDAIFQQRSPQYLQCSWSGNWLPNSSLRGGTLFIF